MIKYPNSAFESLQGRGLTSQRSRDRMVNMMAEQSDMDGRVLQAMRLIPRHYFMEEALSASAYDNTALPIGDGQTISQPQVVARMSSELIRCSSMKKVLELGTGSGYQTAILGMLANQVFTIERIERLQIKARERLAYLEYQNIHYRVGDGHLGWPEQAGFDGIIVTAAAQAIPDALCEQLTIGGCLLIPVGESQQVLMKVIRTESGFQTSELANVSFVPLVKT